MAEKTAAAPATDKVAVLPKRPPQITDSLLGDAAYQRNIWLARPEPGTALNQMLNRAYWTHVAGRFAVRDRIEVVPQDNEYFAELMVVGLDKMGVDVVTLRHTPLQVAEDLAGIEDLVDYDIKYAGEAARWRAVRKSDGFVAVQGLHGKDAVVAWLRENAPTKKR